MRYFSMFSGIGGFEYGIEAAYTKNQSTVGSNRESATSQHSGCPLCVGFSEIDKYAVAIYQYHFPTHKNFGDAFRIVPEDIPDFDLLCGGFPCQAFSIAGKRGGFEDTRGTLFFEIARIARVKRPKLLLLENVKGLLSHDSGRTFGTILATLSELGYFCEWQVLNSKDFGVPQNRERVFIVGRRKDNGQSNVFPLEWRQPEAAYEITRKERVYWLSQEISEDFRILSSGISQGEEQELSRQQMQEMLLRVKCGLSESKCREVPRDAEEMDSIPKGMLQVVEELNSWTQSQDKSKTVYGVVSIPTEEMLLLWNNTRGSSKNKGQVQQQSVPADCGSDGQPQGICFGESGTLLLAVQPYQGRLFYSIGDGRNWKKIYSAEVEGKCKTTLSSILEEEVDEKYFLSEKTIQKIVSNLSPEVRATEFTEPRE